MSQPSQELRHSDAVIKYLGRLYADDRREYACRASTPEGVAQWQSVARPALRRLMGLDDMALLLRDHEPTVKLEDPEDMEGYTRQLGHIETEPDVHLPFWLLKPEGDGPAPLAIMPHGHEARGHDTYAGVYRDEDHRRRTQERQADVAVQAARRGFIAIAPNTRGFEPTYTPDLHNRHSNVHCRCHFIHCILAGRTTTGERVWDMARLVDWALTLPEVDSRHILMMGNSGGGMVTTYAAACDPRITIAIPSCSFCTYVGANGLVHQCDCNVVPGIYRFGEFYDVAGLIAPRHLLIVNGAEDPLFPLEEVDRAVAGVRAIYEASGQPEHFAHRYGDGGHRFYSDIMWGFVERAMSA